MIPTPVIITHSQESHCLIQQKACGNCAYAVQRLVHRTGLSSSLILTEPATPPAPSFVKLHGAPLSFRIASAGLGLCQTQSVKLVHPQRLQSAWYVQYYVTSAQQEESGGKIKPDTPTI